MSRKRVLSLLVLLAVLALVASGCAPEVAEDGTVTAPTWIAPLAKPLEWLIEATYTYVLTPIGLASYGLAIILVTILIRALLYPLTRKQMQSMKKMQSIQPKMKEIQEKYGKDREKLAQKQMELYKQEGVNPAGGCLPLLIQMPFLFAFYYALLLLGPKLDEPFLWIPSLAQPEYGQGMAWLQPLTPAHLLSPAVLPFLILPVIYIATQFLMQRMSQASNPSVGGGSANTVMMLMPVMFGYITLIVPSGLSLYWVTSNVLQIIQQGLATGWSGLLPTKKAAPATATSGAAAAKSSAIITTTGTATSVNGATDDVSAGRRRKMRKKKR